MTSKSKSADILEVPSELRVREKAHVCVYKTPEDASRAVAKAIADCIRSNPEKCVLGLATGSTPTGVYEELIRLHKEEGLSFSNVVSFNLDEYYPMEKTQIQSYHRYSSHNLFPHPLIQTE
jgi:glucosamine-6-phosphate deaminase